MSKLIFNLKSVPDDEAMEVKELLTVNHIAFFESPGGNWGVSVHALWLKDESDSERAKALIDEYQLERSEKAQIEKQQKIDNGELETFIQRLFRKPILLLVNLIIVAFLLYISIVPFFEMANA